VRTLHLLYEHKRIMNIRLSYLSLNVVNISPEILTRYSKLEKESLILRNLSIKCGFTKSYKTFDTITYRFKQMIDEEEEILTLLPAVLKTKS
jgi:glutathione peroxidase-family protein